MALLERAQWYYLARSTQWIPRYVSEDELFPPEQSGGVGVSNESWAGPAPSISSAGGWKHCNSTWPSQSLPTGPAAPGTVDSCTRSSRTFSVQT